MSWEAEEQCVSGVLDTNQGGEGVWVREKLAWLELSGH